MLQEFNFRYAIQNKLSPDIINLLINWGADVTKGNLIKLALQFGNDDKVLTLLLKAEAPVDYAALADDQRHRILIIQQSIETERPNIEAKLLAADPEQQHRLLSLVLQQVHPPFLLHQIVQQCYRYFLLH